MPKVYFDERMAERYETYWPELFEPEAIEPAVDFLADLAGRGSALELGVGTGRLGFEEYDVATQIAFSHHYWVIDGQMETFSSPHRYVWPSELDLMARLAGLTLRERYANWQRTPFTKDSTAHISVWHKPPARTRLRPIPDLGA